MGLPLVLSVSDINPIAVLPFACRDGGRPSRGGVLDSSAVVAEYLGDAGRRRWTGVVIDLYMIHLRCNTPSSDRCRVFRIRDYALRHTL